MSGAAPQPTASKKTAARGEVWLIDLTEPPKGREEGGKSRPALILSVDRFNQGPAELIVVVPIASGNKGIPSHVQIDPPEGGVRMRCFIKCEAIRSISKVRLIDRWGTVNATTLRQVEDITKMLLGLP